MPNLSHYFTNGKNWLLHTGWKVRIAIAAVVILFGWLIVPHVLGASKQPTYQTAQVTRGDIISTLTESGNVSTASQVNVTSPTDGVIEDVYVHNGDQVTEGDKLFSVKSTATPQQEASAYASYLNAVDAEQNAQQSKMGAQATLEKDRKAILDAQNAVDQMTANGGINGTNPATKNKFTQNEIDSIQSTLTSAHETFAQDEKKYNQAGTSIAAAQSSLTAASLSYQATQDSVVTAPASGTVANLSAIIGSNVSASSGGGTGGISASSGNGNNSGGSSGSSSNNSSSSTTTTGGTTVLVIGNFSSLLIKAAVSEVDISKVQSGQKATVTLDAFPDKTFVGNVESVDTIGTSSSGVVTYNAYITLISPPSDIKPGMTASVVIQLDKHTDVLTVPSSAVQTSNGQSYVRVMKNGQITQTPVETGLTSDTDTEITSGLNEGDTVVTSMVTPTTSSGSQTTSPFGGGLGGNRAFGGGGGGFGGGAARTVGGGGTTRVRVGG